MPIRHWSYHADATRAGRMKLRETAHERSTPVVAGLDPRDRKGAPVAEPVDRPTMSGLSGLPRSYRGGTR